MQVDSLPNPIDCETFKALVVALGDQASEDIAWAEAVSLPDSAEDFACEAIWVICNSGMKHTVARMIEKRVLGAIREGRPVREVFGHEGKAAAMEKLWGEREALFSGFLQAKDKLAYLASLPWIGNITKYHLAKNCGIDCAKPDIHLQRLADREGTTAHELCSRIADETGYRVGTVDLVLWRACAAGIVNSRTGDIRYKPK